MAGDRSHVEEAYPGDILARITTAPFRSAIPSLGEMMKFTGIPNFVPELFRRNSPESSPLKQKQLLERAGKLLKRAVQVFRPISNNDLIVGRRGALLQFGRCCRAPEKRIQR